MKKCLFMVFPCSLFLVGGIYAATASSASSVADDLCSPQGVAKLVPAFRGQNGQFEVPSPLTDLPRFFQAYDGLHNVIQVALIQSQLNADPYAVGNQHYVSLKFCKDWMDSEVGFSEGENEAIPDFSKGGFGDYGDASFMQGIVPVAGTSDAVYVVPGKGVYISPMPTVLKCVNVLMETSSHDSGTFISPSYALGTKDGQAFLVVNGCQNTSTTLTVNGKTVLTPRSSSYLGIQIAKPYFNQSQS